MKYDIIGWCDYSDQYIDGVHCWCLLREHTKEEIDALKSKHSDQLPFDIDLYPAPILARMITKGI